jgi:hypothetical protein
VVNRPWPASKRNVGKSPLGDIKKGMNRSPSEAKLENWEEKLKARNASERQEPGLVENVMLKADAQRAGEMATKRQQTGSILATIYAGDIGRHT